MPPRPDSLSIVEAAYDFQISEEQWLGGMLRAAQPLLDEGLGVMGFVLDLAATPVARTPFAVGGESLWQGRWREEWWEKAILPMPHELFVAACSFGPAFYASHAFHALTSNLPTFDLYLKDIAERGSEVSWVGEQTRAPDLETAGPAPEVPELFNVQGIDPSGHGVVLVARRATTAAKPPARAAMRSWTRVAAHITAAHRVRRKLGELRGIEGAEAVIAPGGKILHAEGAAVAPAAREALRQAAIDVDRARTSQVRSTAEALELWRALHEGRWSVLERFDADGRRFLVARENEPASDPAPSLSRREQQVVDLLALGHSNKLIAYDLGISVSSVATHIRRAATKLGMDGTRQLVGWSRGRARPRE